MTSTPFAGRRAMLALAALIAQFPSASAEL